MTTAAVRSRAPSGTTGFDPERVRRDFPILQTQVDGKPLAYLDNAATSQKPESVIAAVDRYYRTQNANIHRGVYRLSQTSTELYEGTRDKAREFVNARESREIVFVRGTTEALNLVAQGMARGSIEVGDEIIVTAMEHHSNIVPWQLVAEQCGAVLRVLPMSDRGELEVDDLPSLITDRTRVVAVAHISNALGTVNPIREICRIAHSRGVPVIVDGAQGAPHLRIDVQDLDCDYYTVSGHKMFGPTGIGLLYGKAERLEDLPPYQGGGDMIRSVSFEGTTFAEIPTKFEAGTPNIAGVVGLGAAIDYLMAMDWPAVERYETELLAYLHDQLAGVPGIRFYGTAQNKAGVVSFTLDGVHAHDVGTIVDQYNVAIRTGHHCAQPLMDFYGVPATARASIAFYNSRADVDALVRALGKVREVIS